MRTIGVVILLWLSFVALANGQFIKFGTDKTVVLTVSRPPQAPLVVKRVAFGDPRGACADEAIELVDRMILPDFQQNQMDVVERQALDQIMAEHNFNQTSAVDPQSATQLGKILGPSALIIVNVNTCRSEQIPLVNTQKNMFDNSITRTFISKTRYSLEGSVRTVDLTTGKILGSHDFESKPEKTNQSNQGQPEFPPIDEVKDSAMQAVKFQVHSMFFPYGNPVTLTFYDDKDCDLKQVYELYKNGDHDGALHLVDQNLQQCKSSGKKDKTLSRAYYDAGVLHCLNKEYDAAADLFKFAMDNKGADAVAAASSGCQQAKSGTTQLEAYRARLDQIPSPSPITSPGPQAIAPPKPTQQADQAQGGDNGARAEMGKSVPSVAIRLKALESYYKQGLITKKEYDDKRAQILKDL